VLEPTISSWGCLLLIPDEVSAILSLPTPGTAMLVTLSAGAVSSFLSGLAEVGLTEVRMSEGAA
jgi:hypothetical protein